MSRRIGCGFAQTRTVGPSARSDDVRFVTHKPKEMAPTMVDVVKQQARIRYRAKRLGYCLMQTRELKTSDVRQAASAPSYCSGPMGWPCPLPR